MGQVDNTSSANPRESGFRLESPAIVIGSTAIVAGSGARRSRSTRARGRALPSAWRASGARAALARGTAATPRACGYLLANSL